MKTVVKTKTRVGRITYFNTLPFHHNLFSQKSCDFECCEGYPTKINLAIRQGKMDIAPISSLEYLNHPKKYVLLPDIAIGARDFSGSVLLLSREKIQGLNDQVIGLSSQSLSSVALLRILLKFKYKFNNRFVYSRSNPDEMLRKFQAALVIGDEALLYQPEGFVYKYDLSELWWEWTGKPFCFALWAVRRAFAEKHSEEVGSFYRRLKSNLDLNLADLETLIKDSLVMSFLDPQFPKIFGYLFNLSYGLDASMREGLELFYRLAHRLGISPHPKKLEFFKV